MKAGARWAFAIFIVVNAAAVGGPALAGTSLKLDASVVVTAPANASAASGSFFESVSCPTAGFCAAGGGYRDSAGRFEPMVAQSENGKWSRATELHLPSNASVFVARVDSIACTGPGDCVAVGGFSHPFSGNEPAFIAVQAKGRWQRATVPSPPQDSPSGQPRAELTAVACIAPRSCVAVGAYDNRAGNALPMVITESRGRWGRTSELPLPVSAQPSLDVGVGALSCPALGHCVAGGQYVTRSGTSAAMVIAQAGSHWQATETGLPPDASRIPSFRLASISCPGIGDCVAVGTYTSRLDNSSSFAVAETNGQWGQPVRIAIAPANAARLAHLGLDSVSCTKPGACVAVGTYTNRRHGILMMTAAETSGKWIKSSEITLPGGAVSTQQNGIWADGGDVDCPSSGNCAVVGSYEHGTSTSGLSITSADAAQTARPGGR